MSGVILREEPLVRRLGCCLLLLVLSGLGAHAQASPPPPTSSTVTPDILPIPLEAQPSDHFDAEAATNAYLALMPKQASERSDAYFEGGYWLQLWDFLLGSVAISLILLELGWSGRMRDFAERVTRWKPLHTLVYWAQYLLVTSILGFPLAVYEGYFREHQYGLATQTFGPWFEDQVKGFLVSLVLFGIVLVFLFGVVRRFPNTWWIGGSLVSLLFVVFVVLISPVYLVPIFNDVTPLKDPKIVDPVLRLARANGIPSRDVYEIDASRQTTRMSANVSGFGSTMRITMNDNLVRRGSAEEIEAVMGHEMGHYVLNHVYLGLLFAVVVTVCAFAFFDWSLGFSLARWGGRWGIRGVGDLAVLPLAALLASAFFFFLTPILNTFVRSQEKEADMYGLNASRAPDGFARAAIHLGECRKMSPGPFEEWVFYDHPSGRNRIHSAMVWKAENLVNPRTEGGAPR